MQFALAGAMQQQSTSGQQASQSRIVSRPTLLDGGEQFLESSDMLCANSNHCMLND